MWRKKYLIECPQRLRFILGFLMVVSCNASFLDAQDSSDSFPAAHNPIHRLVVTGKEKGTSTPGLKFSPNCQMLASYTKPGFMTKSPDNSPLSIIDVKSGVLQLEIPEGWIGFAFCPDNEHFFTWSLDAVSLWSFAEPKHIAQLRLSNVQRIKFICDGKRFVTETSEASWTFHGTDRFHIHFPATVKFWDLATLKHIPMPIDQLGPWVDPIVTPDGKLLAGFELEKEKYSVVEVETGNFRPAPLEVEGCVYGTKLAIDGQQVFFGGSHRSVGGWNLATSKPSALGAFFQFPEHELPVEMLSMQRNEILSSETLVDPASVYFEHLENKWRMKNIVSDQIVQEFPDQTNLKPSPRDEVHFLNPNRMVLSRRAWTTRFFDLTTGKKIAQIDSSRSSHSIGLSSDGLKIAFGELSWFTNDSISRAITVWDVKHQKQLFSFDQGIVPNESVPNGYGFLDFLPNGNLMSISSTGYRESTKGSNIELFDATSGRLLKDCVQWSPGPGDGLIHATCQHGELVAYSMTNAIYILDSNDLILKHKLIVNTIASRIGYSDPSVGTAYCLVFSPDGRKLAAASTIPEGNQVTCWNVLDGKLDFITHTNGPIADLQFVENGKSIQLVDISKGRAVLTTISDFRRLESDRQLFANRFPHREIDLGLDMHPVLKNLMSWRNRPILAKFNAQTNKFVCVLVDSLAEENSLLQARQYDLSSDTILRQAKMENHGFQKAKVSADGNCLVTLTSEPEPTTYIVDTVSGEILSKMGNSEFYGKSPNGKLMLSRVKSGGLVSVWNVESGHEIGKIPGDESAISCFSSDNGYFAISNGGSVCIWRLTQFND